VTARETVKWLWIPVLLAFAWSGWVIWSRAQATAAIEREAQRKEALRDAEIVEKMGGGELKILMLYANPGVVAKGAKGLLCYGVANAASVVFEPEVAGAGPSLSRCVEIRPTRTTEYTLHARDAKGREVTEKVNVIVR
jgi:hypothetical protein